MIATKKQPVPAPTKVCNLVRAQVKDTGRNSGHMTCPVCQRGRLDFCLNEQGRVWARCRREKCVAFMQ